jgi:hypothetical protein
MRSGHVSHIWVRHEVVRPAHLAVLAHELICHRAWDLQRKSGPIRGRGPMGDDAAL